MWTGKGVMCCPYQESESNLWSSPDICPGYGPIYRIHPPLQCSLLTLGHCLDEIVLLFQPGDLYNHSLPLLFCGFRPELDRFSPTQPDLADLDSFHNLFVPQPADCLVHLLLGPPPTQCMDFHLCTFYYLVAGLLQLAFKLGFLLFVSKLYGFQ